MPTTVTNQPQSNKLCSTLVPLTITVVDTVADTTNIIAKCYYEDTGGTDVQIGGEYRLAPNLDFPDYFYFDSSEIFNTLTKYTLADMPGMTIGNWSGGMVNTIRVWDDIATWKVRVMFQREFINSQGLVEIDPTPYYSNYFYIHEGCPPRKWLGSLVSNNGLNNTIFKYYMLNYNQYENGKHYLTNYPIEGVGSRMSYNVNIRPTESFMVAWYSPPANPQGYQFQISTYDEGYNTNFNNHTVPVNTNRAMQTGMIGMRDVIDGLTPNGSEGADFINVVNYRVRMLCCTNNSAPCTYGTSAIDWKFKVDRTCVGKGYLRFAFKNMLGGYDLVSSTGAYQVKVKNKFSDFQKSQGYTKWANQMSFGEQNWANENIEVFTVTTQPMKRKFADHFAEMFSSVDVYLRDNNDSYLQIADPDQSERAREQPYYFNPIKIKGATIEKWRTTNNMVKMKFTFERSINQRNPRY
tara:strand:- start:10102 stop:11496 length:1395 start_codon:yes stop_codon:yes gene_type:complete